MRVNVSDGVGLEVETAGSGPGLLLVHGFGGAKEDFADHVEALAASHTVVWFDHRGHGASDKPPDAAAYSFARLERDVVEVAGAVGVDHFRLLGHSMGGMVARRVALDHRDRVDALILMDTAPGPVPGIDPDQIEFAAEVGRREGKDSLKKLLDAAAPLETPAYTRLLRERPGYEAFGEKKWDDLSLVMWITLAREIARQADDLDEMRSLDCPVLVIVGELDEPFIEPSQAMAAAIPGALIEVIPDAGHSPQFENPQAWLAAVDGFLAGITAARVA